MRRRRLVHLVKNIGVLGFSEGNGHPYSFSAIINGFNQAAMQAAGWPVIYDYLSPLDPSDFGVAGLAVSHVWCPDHAEAKKVAAAANIDCICRDPGEMLGEVDGVIIARDDWQSHYPLSTQFLEAGLPVLIDKPLSLKLSELSYFRPYLEAGQLMSCSALRYAKELDAYRVFCETHQPKLINGVVVAGWERYGVHLLDGIFSAMPIKVESVHAIESEVRSTSLKCAGGMLVNLTCLGTGPKTFSVQAFAETARLEAEITDNFSAFKRLLCHFRDMLTQGSSSISTNHTLDTMRILIASNLSLEREQPVHLEEIEIL